MRFSTTALPGLILVEPDVFRDARGFFLETFHERKYRAEVRARDRRSLVTQTQAMLDTYPRDFNVDAHQLAATIDMLGPKPSLSTT